MKHHLLTGLIGTSILTSLILVTQGVVGTNANSRAVKKPSPPPTEADEAFALPPGYRDWRLISVAREEGELDDIRAVLGNDIALKAYREGVRPFPEGTVIARIAWSYLSSEENNRTFGRAQSFVAGKPKNGIQFMIKDPVKYASTGGWGYAQFDDGKPVEASMLKSCAACHEAIKDRDFVFTHYAH